VLTADKLRELPDEEVKAALSQLSAKQVQELQYNWSFWARPEQIPPKGDWNTFLALAGRGWGKDLAKTEPIFTTEGWKTMGDLVVGDYVYAWDGTPTKVIDLYHPNPRQLVKFTFSDNTTIVSSVEHDWVTWTHKDRKSFSRNIGGPIAPDWPNWSLRGAGPKMRTSQDIIDTFYQGKREDRNHSIPLAMPLEGTHKPEIKDPYYLGVWLGDGLSSACHEIVVGEEDQEFYGNLWPNHVERSPLIFRAPTEGFQWMRDLGLRKNKHLPECVFTASYEQRLAILQGLMDSDGFADTSSVEFCNTNRSLADAVMFLARSLGQKPVLAISRATLYGKDCGPKYRVTWRPAQGINPFKLPRKANKITFGGSQEARNHHRMIVAYEYVDYEPTVCISVEHKDHLFLAGEGMIPTHNTKASAEWIREKVKEGHKRLAYVCSTNSDVEKVFVKGESGILNCCWEGDKNHKGVTIGMPVWSPTKRSLTWYQDGDPSKKEIATVLCFSAEEPDRLRGPQFSAAACDELCAWNKDEETWSMLQFCLRLGRHPQVFIATTPKPTKLIRQLLKDEKTFVVRGSTFDNAANLADTYLDQVKRLYEGTRLGRQELYAEVMEESEGALWTTEMLDGCQISRNDLPELLRIVVSVDPAVTSNAESDDTGIIVAGVDVNGKCYVLGDYTLKATPQGWASKAVELYYKYDADRIVAERNQGGDMVKHTILGEDEKVAIKMVHASRGKYARAEPVSALYERGLVYHVRDPEDGHNLNELETQQRTWEPLGSIGSPDRLDALVWAITDLALNGYAKPQLKLVYSNSKGLR
jgi:phage terminase large subunit-like protein